MKKFGRTIWVGILTGLAVLFGCSSHKGLSKAERADLEHQRDSIQQVIQGRESACVYGSPEIIREYGAETQRLRNQLNEINARLEADGSKKKK